MPAGPRSSPRPVSKVSAPSWTAGPKEDRGRRRSGAAEQGADPEQEFLGLEGLGEVVVGAGLETGDAVLRGAAGGEEQDRDLLLFAAQRFREGEAGFAGHRDIEDQQVGLQEAQFFAGLGGVFGGDHAEAVLAEVALQQGAQARVVLHH